MSSTSHDRIELTDPQRRELATLVRAGSTQQRLAMRAQIVLLAAGELTDRSRLLLPVDAIVGSVNRFVRGWAAYFRYGNSARRFAAITGIHADALGAEFSANDTNAAAATVVRWCSSNHRTTSGWSPLMESSPHPGPSGPGG